MERHPAASRVACSPLLALARALGRLLAGTIGVTPQIAADDLGLLTSD
jgi:hypothetical protein